MISLDSLPGNLDVWSEVLKYLEISLDHDSVSDIGDKRRALLRVALLSPALTTPALDALWRSMTSLEPITHVINAKSDSPNNSTLQFQADNSGGYWHHRNALTFDDRYRITDFLERIRHMRITIGPMKEMRLWSTLNLMGLALSTSPLPNLESLSLDLSQAGNSIGNWICAIGPLLSPKLTAISYTSVHQSYSAGVDMLQTVLKSRSLRLSNISFQGYPSSSLLQNCLPFEHLETLKLTCDINTQRYTTGSSISEVFEKLPNLKDLEIDLKVFPLHKSTNARGTWAGNEAPEWPPLSSLLRLHIAGDALDILNFLLNGLKSPSLQSLSVTIYQVNGLSWKVFCDRIAFIFPKLHSLCFRRVGGGVQVLNMQDLSALLSRSTMQSLDLDGISHSFSEVDIGGLLDSWPTLHTLAITNYNSIHFPASVLIKISQATHLRNVKLPLELSFLEDALPDEPTVVSRSLVQALTITSIANQIPSLLEKKIEVARNILILFPMVERISNTSPHHQVYLRELEGLIGSFRKMIVTYLRRRELEERTTKRTAASAVVE